MFSNIYKEKKVLVTGHTGFKGSWLCTWLNHLGAKVIGVSSGTVGELSNFSVSEVMSIVDDYRLDIRDADAIKLLVEKVQPDFVFHLAAQALVRSSYDNPLETMTTNAIGTANILDALRTLNKKVVAVMITSDKAYDNVEWVWGYRETDRLGGKDPYSASKGMAELAIHSYIESFFNYKESNIHIGIARAGNVIGGGDWAQDRIVVDCVGAWSEGRSVEIRSPEATRPWQHVLEPLSGYLNLGQALCNDKDLNGEGLNFGPRAEQNRTVVELLQDLSKYWHFENVSDAFTVTDNIPFHEAGLLKLNCDKSLALLEWQAALDYRDTIKFTSEWYYDYYKKDSDMMAKTISQINEYQNTAYEKRLSWA